MTIADPTEEEVRELYFLFAPDKVAQPRLPSVPELVLASQDVTALMRVLDERRNTRIARSYLEEHLTQAARYFPRDLYLQERPSASALDARFRSMQKAAWKLLEVLTVRSARPSEMRDDEIAARLQMAASTYGSRIGHPEPSPPPETIHWNFWETCKLPSVITGVSLLEHWATMVREQLRTERRKGRRNRGNTAFRVLVHRLALVWLHNGGKRPGAGYSLSRGGESAFTRFVRQYLKAMLSVIRDEHLRYTPTIAAQLKRSDDSIRGQLRVFNRRLPPEVARRR